VIAGFIADELARRDGWVSLPPVTYTVTVPVRPGNVRIEPEVFSKYLSQIIKHFTDFGQREFILILGHGGPEFKEAVVNACSPACGNAGASLAAFHIANVLSRLGLADTLNDRHAGAWETSIMMAINSELVGDLSIYEGINPRKYGVVGDPTKASADYGIKCINAVINYIEEFVRGWASRSGCYYDWRR